MTSSDARTSAEAASSRMLHREVVGGFMCPLLEEGVTINDGFSRVTELSDWPYSRKYHSSHQS